MLTKNMPSYLLQLLGYPLGRKKCQVPPIELYKSQCVLLRIRLKIDTTGQGPALNSLVEVACPIRFLMGK